MRGKFITLEGGEGVGKSTQVLALAERLKSRGLDVLVTREPGGSRGAEAIRELLLSGSDDRWGREAEALLFAAARADHVEKLIRPALERGAWVLCDRFIDSSLAYQGGAGGLGIKKTRSINTFALDGCYPDRTFVLMLDNGNERARKRDAEASDRIGGRSDDYHRKVQLAFETIAMDEPERVKMIDASGTQSKLHSVCSMLSATFCHDRGSRKGSGAIRLGVGVEETSSRVAAFWTKGRWKGDLRRRRSPARLADAAGPPVDLPGLETANDHPIVKLVNAQSHPDMRRIERLPKEKGERLARDITVHQVRGLGEFMSMTSALSPWRVAVIDSMDELNKEASNALLKTLEEPPPNTVFFLISHAPGQLLPTIRSRCRSLHFDELSNDAMTSILTDLSPQLSNHERERVIAMSSGSAGRALAFAELDLAKLEDAAIAILRDGDPTNARRSSLSAELGKKGSAERYSAFLELVPSLIAREARILSGAAVGRALDAYAKARELALVAPRVSLDPAATVFQLGGILAEVPASASLKR